jgi:hypothetical protein
LKILKVSTIIDWWFITNHFQFLSGNEVIYQTDPTIIDFSYAEDVPISPYTLLFTAEDLPPLGFKVYTFTKAETAPEEQPHLTVGNDNTSFEIDDDTGLLKSITMNGVTMDVSQDLAYYRSGSYSGAYIFVPLENEKHRVTEDKVKTTPISGDIPRSAPRVQQLGQTNHQGLQRRQQLHRDRLDYWTRGRQVSPSFLVATIVNPLSATG